MTAGTYIRTPAIREKNRRASFDNSIPFWDRVAKCGPDDCWEWQGPRHSAGYGKVGMDGRTQLAHRVAYGLDRIPDGMLVLHHCDNPPCCNISHLFLGTYQDNYDDMIAKGHWWSGNSIKTHCPRGHEYNEANTRVYEGRRFCRVCDRERTARR